MIYIFIIIIILVLIYLIISFIAAYGVVHLDRQPIPKTPQDYGMDYETISFKTSDGVAIKGWLIPANSKKIIIITHVGGLTKYGSTVNFHSIYKLYNKEIEFLKTAKHLHKVGYNILMFDFRNHGESDKSPNGGISTIGLDEYKDVLAALDFIKSRNDLKNMDIGFVSFCMGANSTIIAASKEPEKFAKVRCMMLIQPISMEVFVKVYSQKIFSKFGSSILIPMIKRLVKMMSGYELCEMSPKKYVKDIRVPTLYVQARNDLWTELSDIESFYKNTPAEKEFYWIEDTKHRFESYSYFQNKPEKMFEWLEKWA